MIRGLIFAAVIAAASGAANADARDDALAAMQRCSMLSDRDKRLGCYDATISRAPAAIAAPRAAPPVAAMAAASPPPQPVHRERTSGFMAGLFGDGPARPPQTSVAQFGSESIANGGAKAYPIPRDGDSIDAVSARVADYQIDGGFLTVTLDNGQVWRQTPGANPVGHLTKPATAYSAMIERGSINGSYTLHLAGRAGVIAVRRIR
jgi:hypothetical protein